jgi:hypothetical protein
LDCYGWECLLDGIKPIFDLGAKPFLLAEVFKIILLTLITKTNSKKLEILLSR